MWTAVEEVQAVRYMLPCLGVKVKHLSIICGDNLGVIQNCTISDSLLKKKHVVNERCSSSRNYWKHNFADLLTNAVTGAVFWTLYGALTQG